MLRHAFLLLALLAACGRPLTTDELAFIQQIHGDELDTSRIRLVDGAPVKTVTMSTPVRPRVTCSERIFPPPRSATVTGAPAAIAFFNRILLNPDYVLDNYLEGYPETLNLYEAMFFAHEMTHVWQWQNRTKTGYHPLKAVAEHQNQDDPYLFDAGAERDFLSFGYEQQGAIVEEYVCCAALDPNAPRTERLRQMLADAFPVSRLRTDAVVVGWQGAETRNICQ